jgi:ketosteroid isomerase-like protein
VLEWVVTSTYSADFPGLPPATDQPFSFHGASLLELADGKIHPYTEYWDASTFLVQLEALPAPAVTGTPTP